LDCVGTYQLHQQALDCISVFGSSSFFPNRLWANILYINCPFYSLSLITIVIWLS